MRLLEDYENYLKTSGYSPKTREAYYRDVRLYKEFSESVGRGAEDQDCVYRYLAYLGKKGLEGSSIERKRAAIISYADFYALKFNIKFLDTHSVGSPRKSKHIPHHYTYSEIQELLDLSLKDKALDYRTYFLILMLYGTGLRLSELLGIRPGSIQEKDGSLSVRGKGGKTRLIFLPGPLLLEYKKYRKRFVNLLEKNQCLFFNHLGEPLTARGAQYILARAGEKAHWLKAIHPHAFRHSYATGLLENGADVREVAELLGHASLATTQRYTHLSRIKLKEDYQKFHPHG